jgi:hypothetical protein
MTVFSQATSKHNQESGKIQPTATDTPEELQNKYKHML